MHKDDATRTVSVAESQVSTLPDHTLYGWNLDFSIHWMDKAAAPETLLAYHSCKSCKTGCTSAGRCTCRKHGMHCTVLCGCTACENKPESPSTIEQEVEEANVVAQVGMSDGHDGDDASEGDDDSGDDCDDGGDDSASDDSDDGNDDDGDDDGDDGDDGGDDSASDDSDDDDDDDDDGDDDGDDGDDDDGGGDDDDDGDDGDDCDMIVD